MHPNYYKYKQDRDEDDDYDDVIFYQGILGRVKCLPSFPRTLLETGLMLWPVRNLAVLSHSLVTYREKSIKSNKKAGTVIQSV